MKNENKDKQPLHVETSILLNLNLFEDKNLLNGFKSTDLKHFNYSQNISRFTVSET